MFRLILSLTFVLVSSSAALSQNVLLEFELFNVEGEPDQMLRLEIDDPSEPVIVTQRSAVEIPGGMVDDAFEDLMIGLLTTSIDEESVRGVERGDRPYVRMTIDTSFDRGELSYRQNLFLNRLPDSAIQMMAMFRPFGPPGDAFVARLERLKAQDDHEVAVEKAEDLDARDDEIRLQRREIKELKLEVDSMNQQILEASMKANEVPDYVLRDLQTLEKRLNDTFQLLDEAHRKIRIDADAAQQFAEALEERDSGLRFAETRHRLLTEQMTTAQEKAAATQGQLETVNAELQRVTALPEELLQVADAIRSGVPVVQDVGDRGVIALPAATLFVGGTGDLTEGGRKIMIDLTAALERLGPTRDWALQIGGHSDATPLGAGSKYTDNWDLSLARSITVARTLMESGALPPGRIVASAYGDTRPLSSATDRASLAANRRIELRVVAR